MKYRVTLKIGYKEHYFDFKYGGDALVFMQDLVTHSGQGNEDEISAWAEIVKEEKECGKE